MVSGFYPWVFTVKEITTLFWKSLMPFWEVVQTRIECIHFHFTHDQNLCLFSSYVQNKRAVAVRQDTNKTGGDIRIGARVIQAKMWIFFLRSCFRASRIYFVSVQRDAWPRWSKATNHINDYFVTDFTCHVTWLVQVVASTVYVLLMMGAKCTRNIYSNLAVK
jgi:hypothetical protein